MSYSMRLVVSVVIVAVLAGCASRGPSPSPSPSPSLDTLQPSVADNPAALASGLDISTQGMSSWMELAPAVAASIKWAASRPQDAPALKAPWPAATWSDLRFTLEKLLELLPELDQNPGLLAREFVWLRIEPDTLLTGYYEPFLEASLVPHPEYPYPIYGKPGDLRVIRDLGKFNPSLAGKRLVYRVGKEGIEPYPDREAIDFQGVLQGKGLEIAWAKDLVDVFFLHIQGSGRLVLPDGSTKHVLYAAKNDRGYVALGRVLVKEGLLKSGEVTMPSIRRALQENPDRLAELLSENPNYVFFRLADTGPYGASGARLTPLASVAVNRSVIPLGAVLAVQAHLPHYGGETQPLSGLVLAQDTGAMKPNHLDLFCGADPLAAHRAGHMRGGARTHLLLTKEVFRKSN